MGSFAYLYMMAVGFVTAGILLSLAQLVSGKPLGFALTLNPDLASWGGVALRVFAGPNIVMRNAWQMARLQSQSPIWFGLSAVIAAGWSLFSGAFFLGVILSL